MAARVPIGDKVEKKLVVLGTKQVEWPVFTFFYRQKFYYSFNWP